MAKGDRAEEPGEDELKWGTAIWLGTPWSFPSFASSLTSVTGVAGVELTGADCSLILEF